MIICKNCGVELEPDMKYCPLCEVPVNEGVSYEPTGSVNELSGWDRQAHFSRGLMDSPQRRATWELVSIILILIILITIPLNLLLNSEISWSEYPVAICLILFSYISFFAFLNKGRTIRFIWVFLTASVSILILDFFTGGIHWAVIPGIPLLFFLNAILIGLLEVIRLSKQRGINLIAYCFLSSALFCAGIEATLDLYIHGKIQLVWSMIIFACVIPIAVVLLFMHFRLGRGRDLYKTFHI